MNIFKKRKKGWNLIEQKMGELAKHEAERTMLEQTAKRKISVIESELDVATDDLDKSITTLEKEIKMMALELRGKNKTEKLRTGTIKFRDYTTYEYPEEELLITRLLESNYFQYVKQERSVDKAGLRVAMSHHPSLAKELGIEQADVTSVTIKI